MTSGAGSRKPSDTEPIRLVLCDDHAVVRAGLRRTLEEDSRIEVVGESGSAAEAIALTRRTRPDVVLMDLALQGESGIPAIATIIADDPAIRVVVLTMYDDVAYLREAFAAGASGYVLKSGADVELLHAVHEVAGGRTHVHPRLGAELLQTQSSHEAERDQLAVLSDREKQVLQLLAVGHTNAEIAAELQLSVRTVETYRFRLQQKLEVRSRADLVRVAREAGLVS